MRKRNPPARKYFGARVRKPYNRAEAYCYAVLREPDCTFRVKQMPQKSTALTVLVMSPQCIAVYRVREDAERMVKYVHEALAARVLA